MAHSIQQEIERARLANRKRHYDRMRKELDTLCQEQAGMSLQEFLDSYQEMVAEEFGHTNEHSS